MLEKRAYTAALAARYGTIESILIGRIIGEAVGLVAIVYMARGLLRDAVKDVCVFVLLTGAVVVVSGAFILMKGEDADLGYRLAISAGALILIGLGAALVLPQLIRRAYGRNPVVVGDGPSPPP